jgi:hypothetical protein
MELFICCHVRKVDVIEEANDDSIVDMDLAPPAAMKGRGHRPVLKD